MGIVERRERLKIQVRSDIVKTAKEIARQDGWTAVSIRKIAEVIEYSPPILYEYFESKDKLLEAIRMEGFDILQSEFVKIKGHFSNPQKQLVEVAQRIWNFAVENPEVFQVMFNLEGAYCDSKNVYGQAMSIKGNAVWEMIAGLRPRSGEMVTKTYYEWWCLTYGFISITMTTQPRYAFPQAEPVYMEGVRRFIRSIM
ncbi:TetR/AcrR family transcriptional regulator [Dyadobacter sp. CY326]|uniref:TetR/AcrR family transcriptional regulator n=1 Tax=Dyadobacter sp. CY326 TaxID=2907300 RepID=UPI001F17F8FC|nr:TetR/AcrR family transcriptional regulator [Dyadobacter sp. CY326]MCE7066004.1 TetR/AcrR family transcriptional regulator [Dyadobacter sp. CY326]